MWIITNDENEVVDKASNALNLSRGYDLARVAKGDDAALLNAGYVIYELSPGTDVKVEDSYDGKDVVQNDRLRAQKELASIRQAIIQGEIYKDKANSLNFTAERDAAQADIDELNTRKTALETVISQ